MLLFIEKGSVVRQYEEKFKKHHRKLIKTLKEIKA